MSTLPRRRIFAVETLEGRALPSGFVAGTPGRPPRFPDLGPAPWVDGSGRGVPPIGLRPLDRPAFKDGLRPFGGKSAAVSIVAVRFESGERPGVKLALASIPSFGPHRRRDGAPPPGPEKLQAATGRPPAEPAESSPSFEPDVDSADGAFANSAAASSQSPTPRGPSARESPALPRPSAGAGDDGSDASPVRSAALVDRSAAYHPLAVSGFDAGAARVAGSPAPVVPAATATAATAGFVPEGGTAAMPVRSGRSLGPVATADVRTAASGSGAEVATVGDVPAATASSETGTTRPAAVDRAENRPLREAGLIVDLLKSETESMIGALDAFLESYENLFQEDGEADGPPWAPVLVMTSAVAAEWTRRRRRGRLRRDAVRVPRDRCSTRHAFS